MANSELLGVLSQGVGVWNQWRQDHLYRQLHGDVLINVDLSRAELHGAALEGANMHNTNLSSASLSEADLSYANLSEANLTYANLRKVDLSYAHLSYADLRYADLSNAILYRTDLSNAILYKTDLSNAILKEAIFSQTVFANNDLRTTRGLIDIIHRGPSHIALYTVQLPQDGSALHFLRGAGIPDEWIDDYCARMMHPIQYHSCFISYSHQDERIARRLHADLQDNGVRCWFASEDMKIGDKIRARINEAIHVHEKVLLLLSKHALASGWVEDEVEAAFAKEREQQREVLFPVRLDEQVMLTTEAWAVKLRRARHIGNFTNWTDLEAYQQSFDRLLRDLKKANP